MQWTPNSSEIGGRRRNFFLNLKLEYFGDTESVSEMDKTDNKIFILTLNQEQCGFLSPDEDRNLFLNFYEDIAHPKYDFPFGLLKPYCLDCFSNNRYVVDSSFMFLFLQKVHSLFVNRITGRCYFKESICAYSYFVCILKYLLTM